MSEANAPENINEDEKTTHLDQELNVSARHSSEALSNHMHDSLSKAKVEYSKAFGHEELPDEHDLEELRDKYKEFLPKSPSLSRKAERQSVISNAKTGKYDNDQNRAIIEEHTGQSGGNQSGKKDTQDPNKPPQSGKGGTRISLFRGVKEAFKRPPLTEELVKNNIEVRKRVHQLEQASALNRATQGALAAHLSTLPFDVEKAQKDIIQQTPSAEAQQLMNDPKAQSLIRENDLASKNLMAQLNPQTLQDTQSILESAAVDKSLKDAFKRATGDAVNAVESNGSVPSNDQSNDPAAMEALRKFIDSIKSAFGIGSGAGKAKQMGMS